jgi:16S rRNA C1402 N4-methylase RsmH
MVETILSVLKIEDRSDAIYVDGTVGAGGHSRAILHLRSDSQLMGMDRDPFALELAAQHLADFGKRAHLVHRSYLEMQEALTEWLDDPEPQVDGVLLDLGVSSMQFDTPERGFAFRTFRDCRTPRPDWRGVRVSAPNHRRTVTNLALRTERKVLDWRGSRVRFI